MEGKIVSLDEVGAPDSLGERRILVGGCFDVLHVGHIELLKGAKNCEGAVIVALESDEFIEQKKHRQFLHSQRQRAAVLSSIRYVDVVILLPLMKSDEDYFLMIQKISPHVIAVEEGDLHAQKKREHASKIGTKVVEVVPHIKTNSSSLLLTLLEEQRRSR